MAVSPHAPAVREALRSVRGAVADATEKLVAARDELADRTANTAAPASDRWARGATRGPRALIGGVADRRRGP